MRIRSAPLARNTTRLLAVVFIAIAPISPQDDGLTVRVDYYLSPVCEGNNLGAVLIAKGDHVLVSSAYGESSYELHAANSPSTRFHIASVSKPFTAAAILILEQRGMLHVSDPVSRFLPDFPNGHKITLQNLLTHTSGIPNVNNWPSISRHRDFLRRPLSGRAF